MAQSTPGWQRRLEEILREHTDLVLADSTLEALLAHLARGAAELSGCPPELSFIRVVNPRTAISMQDVWAVEQEESRKGAFAEAVSVAIREYGPQRPTTPSLHVESALIVPLLGGKACYGYLCLGSSPSHPVATRRLPLILVLAHQALQAIHSEPIRSRAALVGVAETASLTHEKLLVDLQRVAEQAADTLRINDVIVEILGLTEERDALVTLAVAGRLLGAKREVLPGYFAAGATEAWQAITKDDIHERASIGRDGKGRDGKAEQPGIGGAAVSTSVAGSRTVVAMPLRDARGEILGVMNVEAQAPRTLVGATSQLQSSVARAEALLRMADPTTRAAAASLRSVLARIGNQMPNLLDPERKKLRALYQATLRRAVQMIGALDLKAAIAFCGEKVFTITPDATYGYTRDLIQVWSWSAEEGLTGIAWKNQEAFRFPDVHVPELADVYIKQDPETQSEMVIPLLHGDQVVGVLDFISPRLDAFTPKHQELIEAFAHQVVQTLERARDIRSLWLAKEDLGLIQKTSEGIEGMLRDQTDPGLQRADKGHGSSKLRDAREKLLKKLLGQAIGYTRSKYGAIFATVRLPGAEDAAAGEESIELVEMTSYGLAEQQHITHLPLARSSSKVAVKAVIHEHPQNVSNMNRDAPDGALFGSAVKSALAVPIRGGEHVLGVLCLESTDPRMYSPAQVNRVAVLASQAANVISSANLSLYRLKMRRLLNLVDEVMTTSLAPGSYPIHQQIREDILQAARDLTEQHDDGYASLWLVDNGKLHYETSIPELSARKEPQPGIVKLAFEREGPVVVPDVDESSYKALYRRSYASTQSELAVPLLDPDWQPGSKRGRVLGVINVESPRKPAFSGRDVEIIELLARIMVTSMRLTEMHNDRINFLADVSHGLPPLSAAIGRCVARLRKGGVVEPYAPESEMRRTFEELARGIATLSTFIECSYTLTTHEKLGAPIDMEEVSLRTVARDMAHALQFYAQRNKRRIDVVADSSDVTVKCAKHLVRVAVFALIENAIEHGTDNDVILVRVRRSPSKGGRIEVIDHGKPIPPEERKWLFSRRYRMPRPRAGRASESSDGSDGASDFEHHKSLGIGLDHVWRIIHDVHGGQAKYRHERRGKVFYLDLPPGSGEMT